MVSLGESGVRHGYSTLPQFQWCFRGDWSATGGEESDIEGDWSEIRGEWSVLRAVADTCHRTIARRRTAIHVGVVSLFLWHFGLKTGPRVVVTRTTFKSVFDFRQLFLSRLGKDEQQRVDRRRCAICNGLHRGRPMWLTMWLTMCGLTSQSSTSKA